MHETTEKDVQQLNSFLRGELSAVEAYDKCLERLQDPKLSDTLREVRKSHLERAQLLERKVVELGGEPSQSSGPWGGLAKLMAGGASMFGEKAAIYALEEGEDQRRNDYKRDLDDLSTECQALVRGQLLPEQLRTHDTVSHLKKTLKH